MRDVTRTSRRFGVALLILTLLTATVAAQVSVAPTQIWSNPDTGETMIGNVENDAILLADSSELREVDTSDGSTLQTETVSLGGVQQGVHANGYYIVIADTNPPTAYAFHESNLSQAWSVTLTNSNTPTGAVYDPENDNVIVSTFGNGGYLNVISTDGTLENQFTPVGEIRDISYEGGSVYLANANANQIEKRNVGSLGTLADSYSTPNATSRVYATSEKIYALTLFGGTNYFELYESNFTEYRTAALDIDDTQFDIKTFEDTDLIMILNDGNNEFIGYNRSLDEQWNVSSTSIGSTDDWQIDDTTANVTFYIEQSGTEAVAFETSVTSPTPDTTATSLELEIDRWMPFNSTQGYEVYLNETNTTTGESTFTEVTADANVTIYNITNTSTFDDPIVTVNNTSDTLVSYDQTGVVAVNATYQGNTLGNATNLTVGNRNLSNIGIMPPSQWLTSFFEIDSTVGGHGIGSPMQWILFIVLMMATASRMFDNPWAGIGSGVMVSILMWVLDFIGLGVVLSTVFIGILLSLMLIRARRTNVSVGGGGGQQ